MATLHLAVALRGTGWHPDARHEPGTRSPVPPDLVHTAERGLLDLVTIDDDRAVPPGVSPTGRIGLAPTVPASIGPSVVAVALSRVDRPAPGRVGWLVPAPARAAPGHPNPERVRTDRAVRPPTPAAKARDTARLDAAADTVDAVRLRCDTDPLVVTVGHGWEPFRFAARSADVVCTVPQDAFGAALLVEHVRAAERDTGRAGEPLRVLADLVVLLDDTEGAARECLARPGARDPQRSDAAVVATTASGLADLLLAWRASGLDGYRLRPARLPDDLDRITDELVPELQRRGAFRTAYEGPDLFARFGLPRLSYAGSLA